jgi:2,5-diamino-6-(ribosylamino)-4(3H)-pyrimidinone 5'-phosphate reductase
MLPHVVLHVEASLDGRIDHIRPDVGRFYSLAAGFREDAILTGADTLLQGEGLPARDDEEPPTPQAIGGDGPLFVVTDSRCRFDRWHWLRKQPYWRDVVALVAEASPPEGLERLADHDVPTIVCGEQRVDLREALETLAARYEVQTVRVDSGGALSGALVREGLVDEVSVLLEPVLVGGVPPRTFLRGPDPAAAVRRREMTPRDGLSGRARDRGRTPARGRGRACGR